MVTQVITCYHCDSENILKNGRAPNSKQKYLCHYCGRQSREDPGSHAYTPQKREEILSTTIALVRTLVGLLPAARSDTPSPAPACSAETLTNAARIPPPYQEKAPDAPASDGSPLPKGGRRAPTGGAA